MPVFLVVAALAAGEGRAQAQPTLVILGSSTAEGIGATNKDSSWVGRYTKAMAARAKPWKVINLALGGYTTFHIRPTGSAVPGGRPAPDTARNITKGLSLKPQGIIVNMPSNDANSGYSAAEQKANYDTLAALAQRAGVHLWVCSPQPRTTLINDAAKKATLLEVKDWVLSRFGSRSIDFWTGIARADASIDPQLGAGDGVHLNDKGHKLLFDRVMAEQVPEYIENVTGIARSGRTPALEARFFRAFLQPGFPYDARGRALPARR